MSTPFITSRSATISTTRVKSAADLATVFTSAVQGLEEVAKKEGLKPVWSDVRIDTEESGSGFQSLVDAGPWLIVPMVGERE